MPETTESIGDRIKQTRGKMTQQEFADLLGLGRNTVVRYESGKTTPDSDFFIRLEKKFNVSPGWMISGGKVSKKEAEPAENEQWILRYYRNLTPEARDTIDKLIKILPTK